MQIKEDYSEEEIRKILNDFSDVICANYSDKFIYQCAKEEVEKVLGRVNPFHVAIEIINIAGGVEGVLESKKKRK